MRGAVGFCAIENRLRLCEKRDRTRPSFSQRLPGLAKAQTRKGRNPGQVRPREYGGKVAFVYVIRSDCDAVFAAINLDPVADTGFKVRCRPRIIRASENSNRRCQIISLSKCGLVGDCGSARIDMTERTRLALCDVRFAG